MIAIVLCAVLVLLCLKLLKNHRQKYEGVNRIPGPPPLPILGNILDFGATTSKMLENLLQMSRKYGPIFRVWFGPACVTLVVTGPEYIEQILVTKPINDKGFFYKFFKDWLGTAFPITSGVKWYTGRKITAPFFNSLNVEKFVPTFNTNANKLVKLLKTMDLENPVDLQEPITFCTMDNMCQTAICTTCDDQSKLKFWKDLKLQVGIIFNRTFSIFTRFDAIYKRTEEYRMQKESALEGSSLINHFILTRKIERQNGMLGEAKPKTLLDIFLNQYESHSEYTLKEVYNNINAVVIAGTETTSIIVDFCLYQLAKHQDIQGKVAKEVEAIFGDDDLDDVVTIEDLQRFEYLDCVLKETLRMFTPLPCTERTIPQDIVIDGKRIPKGTSILFFLLGTHRSETLYPDPDRFDPDRFLPGNHDKSNPYAFVPFGAGPRKCVGWKFATIEAKIIIGKIVRSFRILPVEGHELILEVDLLLKSANGLPVILEPKGY